MRRLTFPMLLAAGLSACAAPGGPYPSLQPRSAEAIDPRVPVDPRINVRPVNPALSARLARLIAQARSGHEAFAAAAADAERLAAAAAANGSESWTVAQEALSGAIAARRPTVEALAEIDEIAATALETQGGIAPSDLAAIQGAASEVGAIERAQAARISAVQRRLGG